jgi:dipeptidyl aminopeptidase/acylaminoacyl peptidase
MNKAPYGHWTSPITPEWLTHSQKKFGQIVLDADSVYWDECRPNEKGRYVIVERTADGTLKEHTAEGMSCRTRVHEYGGLAFAVSKGNVYFVNDKDQRIYLKNEPLTEAGVRVADFHIAGNYLFGVGEKGRDNFLFSLHLPTKKFNKIASGHDFYSSPAISPDGKQIAFLTWDHPNMPWDGTDLWVGELYEGEILNPKKVAGGKNESIFQPAWSPEGVLHFVSDRTGFWNLYTLEGPVHPMEAEFGMPGWVFGMSTYAFTEDKIVCCYTRGGLWEMAEMPPWKKLDLPWTFYTQIRSTDDKTYFIAASSKEDRSIVEYDRMTEQTTVIAHNPLPHIDPQTLSIPELITFPSHGRKSFAIYYPPRNKEWQAPEGTLPPLIVMSHGGPTSQVAAVFDLKIQFWTSRGFAVVDVNYGGSTGYGRAYRDALKKNWGIIDVQDCESAAQYLISQKKADPKRVAIRGGSAGGFTTLAALTFGDTFTVGASYYGVSDLKILSEETHKFESHYLDELIGPYPEAKSVYEARSPLLNVDKLHCPVIFFQGSEDLIVPVDQSERMYNALKKKGIETELIIYPGEQHGFRNSENIKDSLMRELAFYNKIWK